VGKTFKDIRRNMEFTKKIAVMKRSSVLSISLDKNIVFQEFSDAQERQKDYSVYFRKWLVVVLNSGGVSLSEYHWRNFYAVPTNSPSLWLAVFKAIWVGMFLARRFGVELITAQDPLAAGWVGVILKKILHKPLNIQFHTDYFLSSGWLGQRWYHRLFVPLIKWVVSNADSIRVDNAMKAKKLKEAFPRLKTMIFQAPMRVDLSFFWKKVTRKRLIHRFVSVGRLATEKNFPLLIRTFREVVNRYPEASLRIVGSGPEKKRLTKLIKKLGLERKVFLLGAKNRQGVRKELWRADVFVLASDYEGWGLVFSEAMAAGLPIVCTRVGSVGELVIDGKTGLVSTSKKYQLAEKMGKLIDNPIYSFRLATGGQRRVEKLFQPKVLTQRWMEGLYRTGQL